MKIRLIIIFAIAFGIMACENQEIIVEDFGTTAVFFPFQSPVRTIIQGKYDLGFNDNDNNGKFEIGVRMSGVFRNETDRQVHFELAPELIDAAALGVDTVNVKVLPPSYYTIEQPSPVTIPAGSTDGRIPIQLQDAFFEDPLSFADFGDVHYVVPLKITRIEKLDSLLTGVPIVTNPIKIKIDDWNPAPKDYTLFGIKFMNKYQGVYLRRGADRIVGSSIDERLVTATGVVLESEVVNIDTTSVYRADFVVRDETVSLSTAGKNSIIYSNKVRRGLIPSEDNVNLKLVFDGSENVTITSVEGDKFDVTGTGKFVENGDEWGGEPRDVIYLEYQYRDLNVAERRVSFGRNIERSTLDLMHTVKDTLVIRNRDVKFEQFTVNFEKSGI